MPVNGQEQEHSCERAAGSCMLPKDVLWEASNARQQRQLVLQCYAGMQVGLQTLIRERAASLQPVTDLQR